MTDRSRLDLALSAGQAAGALALASYQDSALKVETKRDRSVVTAADRAAELLLRERIEAAFPTDAIVGEEHGVKEGTSGWTWYLDPIDGTQAFVRGVPLWGTLIGVERDGESRVGVIVLPALGEMVHAAKGMGCHWTRGMTPDGRGGFSRGTTERARVSGITTMKEAMVCTSWINSFEAAGNMHLVASLCAATDVFRGWGDCYGYALVATGRAEIMIDPALKVWDAAPLLICIEEAGGRYTTFAGKPDIHGGSAVASNGPFHDEILRILQA